MGATDAEGLPVGRHPGWPARLGPLLTARGTVLLRPPRLRDAGPWSQARLRDRTYLQQWEPTAVGGWQERNALMAWPAQWASLRGMARRGQALPFSITVDGEFAGQLTVGNIVRGALRSGWLGYWVTERLAGGGVATAAVALAVDHCFGPAGLHRLEATVRPENLRSVRVLEKSGFRREGLFLRYLDVAGAWRDHYVYALTVEEVPEGAVTALIRAGRASRPRS
ncbi:ribosomal-protein-alanine N-acetyltransferase [Saccharopolyspora subtropica]|uniref:GNAT family protein n=1 Tax=Saccharopolyspora thermophila TaxID=89367 RepID=A0A917JHQ8_9PSEU|nr:GNAT family protein [Saccharopolyspora subtropica]GGI69146.1 ribosomal-protein-alanine N-acetyltransferase [Saccharopolyspora subtropica]